MHSPEQPANPNCHYRRCVRLGLDRATKPRLKCGCTFLSGIGCIGCGFSGLAVKILCCASSLIHESLGSHSSVARDAPEPFFHFAAHISGGSRYAIFVHGHYSG
jgi:hypothetical protein